MSRITTLTGVSAHLEKHNESPHTPHFTALINSKRNNPLKCTPPVKARFGALETDVPQLGKRPSPFATIKKQPTTGELRDMLLAGIKSASEAGELVYVPSHFDQGDDMDLNEADAAAELVRNLENPKYRPKGFIPSLACAALDELTETTRDKTEGCITETPMECSVFPRGTLIPLQHHNETTSSSTLLIGSILWIIWPPTDENLGVLHQAYNDFAVDYDEEKLNVASQLVGGLVFVQSTSEGLRIPPYCIMLGLTTQSTVLAKYSTLSVRQFINMLGKLSFLESWWKTEVNGEEKRADFGRALLPRFQRIWSGEFGTDPPAALSSKDAKGGAQCDFVHSWDSLVQSVVNVVDAETAGAVKKAWTDYLIGVVGRNCAICGRRLQSKARQMADHFATEHWPKASGDDGAIETNEAREADGPAADSAATKNQAEHSEDMTTVASGAEDVGDGMEMDDS